MQNNDTKPHIIDLIHAIKGEPSIRANEVFIKATSPDEMPYWELDPRFLNPYAPAKEVMTWCRIGERKAIPRQGVIALASTPGTGKSAAMYALLMNLIKKQAFNTMTPEGEPPRLIIVFDTEMPEDDLLIRYGIIRNYLGDQDAMRLRIVPLMGLPPSQKLEIIEDMCERYNPDVVCFDTITRLVEDYNASTENAKFADLIMSIARNKTVFAITHFTFGTEKLKGALGSQMEEIAREWYKVKRENGITELIVKKSRFSSIDDATTFQFTITENGYEDASQRAEEIKQMQYQEWRKNFVLLFEKAHVSELSHKDLTSLVMSEGIGERDAQNKIANAFQKGVLKKERRGQRMMYSLTDPINF